MTNALLFSRIFLEI